MGECQSTERNVCDSQTFYSASRSRLRPTARVWLSAHHPILSTAPLVFCISFVVPYPLRSATALLNCHTQPWAVIAVHISSAPRTSLLFIAPHHVHKHEDILPPRLHIRSMLVRQRCPCIRSREHSKVRDIAAQATIDIILVRLSFAYMEGRAFRHGDIVRVP